MGCSLISKPSTSISAISKDISVVIIESIELRHGLQRAIPLDQSRLPSEIQHDIGAPV